MKKHMDIKKFIVLVLLGSNAFAYEDDHILRCEISTNNRWLQGCKVEERQIAPKQDFDVELELNFQFNCKDQNLKNIGIIAEDNHSFTSLQNLEKMSISGIGPFLIVDRNPDWTSFARLSPNCYFKILDFKTTPSFKTIEKWKTEKESLQSEIQNYRNSAQTFHELTGMMQAFLAIETLFKQSGEHYLKDSDSRNQVKDILKCSKEQSLEDCNLIENIMLQSSILSLEEKRALSRLNIVLQNFVENPTRDDDFSINKHLEELSSIVCKKDKFAENDAISRNLKSLEDKAQRSLCLLWHQSNRFIDWNGEEYAGCE